MPAPTLIWTAVLCTVAVLEVVSKEKIGEECNTSTIYHCQSMPTLDMSVYNSYLSSHLGDDAY